MKKIKSDTLIGDYSNKIQNVRLTFGVPEEWKYFVTLRALNSRCFRATARCCCFFFLFRLLQCEHWAHTHTREKKDSTVFPSPLIQSQQLFFGFVSESSQSIYITAPSQFPLQVIHEVIGKKCLLSIFISFFRSLFPIHSVNHPTVKFTHFDDYQISLSHIIPLQLLIFISKYITVFLHLHAQRTRCIVYVNFFWNGMLHLKKLISR